MSFGKKELCAICGSLIHSDKGIRIKIKGKEIFICSEECKDKWEKIWKK